MFKKSVVLALFAALWSFSGYGQDFESSGSPYANIFFNFHSDFEGEDPAFDVSRAYLGYEHNFSEMLSGDITLDVGQSSIRFNDSVNLTSSLQLTAYLKKASLTYKSGNLLIHAGMIGLQQFKVQEKAWGYRYVEKSFQDLYGMGPSADMGFLVQYEFSPLFSADFTMRNGEGYKKLQADDDFNYGLGLTFSPFEGLTIRGFYDYMTDNVSQYTLAHFIGYENDNYSLGAEYNTQLNHKNKDEQNLSGYSFYGTYILNEQFQVFGRFDDLSSNTLTGGIYSWNFPDDGNFVTTGIEYAPVNNTRIALNYKGWFPEDDALDVSNYLYLNFQFAF